MKPASNLPCRPEITGHVGDDAKRGRFRQTSRTYDGSPKAERFLAMKPLEPEAAVDPAAPVEVTDILVTGELFRNQTEDPNPVLSCELENFQRFEPVSVGEMLKRVPDVTFTSDVLEYQASRCAACRPASSGC